MNENIIEFVDKKSIKLPNGKYAMIYNGRMIILEKINTYGMGYRTLISFSFDDFEVLKKLAISEGNGCRSCMLGLCPDGNGGFIPCTICGRER